MKKIYLKIKSNLLKNLSLYLAVLGLAIGIFLAVNFNSNLPRILSPASSLVALAEMEKDMEAENQTYKDTLAKIESQISDLQEKTKSRQTGLKGLVNEVEALKVKAGLTDVSGEGIKVLLDDSEQRRTNPNSIAHASDMRDLVNHFFASGAKAISIEGAGGKEERVSFFTSIDCVVNTVLINGTKMVPPFVIKVLGNRQALISAVSDRQALKQIYDRVDKEGLKFYVIDEVDRVSLKKYSGPVEVKNAKLK